MKKKTAIILPVYNEDLNGVALLLTNIKKFYRGATIIIVDDSKNSTKRKKILSNLINSPVFIIARSKKSGRGDAVLTGLKYALRRTDLEYFFEMDSDYSHDPKDLLIFDQEFKLLRPSVILGSRYLKKSKIINWPPQRLYFSKIINKFLKLLLRVDIHDYTNGYRFYTKEAVKYLINKNPKEKGFILLSETIFLLKNGGFTISEIPITFTDRKEGKSSVSFIDLLENLIGAFRIRLRKYE